MPTTSTRQHGVKGVYYAGDWLDIEDCDRLFSNPPNCSNCVNLRDDKVEPCPRSRSRPPTRGTLDSHVAADQASRQVYDVVIIGAGCVGAGIARELSRYQLSVLLVEAADDVSQGATKGNSGIVHAGYDDKPGSVRAKYCWKGNQMFPQLDKELRFGYQKNGSLVVAFNKKEKEHLTTLKKRGEQNGVQNLRIIDSKAELQELEPAINKDAIAALYSPDAGNVIPYEFAIALAENAVDNGVELVIRRKVNGIKRLEKHADGANFEVTMEYWEPAEYIANLSGFASNAKIDLGLLGIGLLVFGHYLMIRFGMVTDLTNGQFHVAILALLYVLRKMDKSYLIPFTSGRVTQSTPLAYLVKKAGRAYGKPDEAQYPVTVSDMLIGGSGSQPRQQGQTVVAKEVVKCKYIVNCAGGASDQIARMVNDTSFTIKPRLGDYLLLNRNQVSFVRNVVARTGLG